VVLPAYVEPQPRPLLAALARGVPVICSAACGVEGLPGVHLVSPGGGGDLRRALREVLWPRYADVLGHAAA
jgi:glycosyltransferase involved in cell wall biosynthesis